MSPAQEIVQKGNKRDTKQEKAHWTPEEEEEEGICFLETLKKIIPNPLAEFS